jgi:flagellar hook-basal body complex protein FliE
MKLEAFDFALKKFQEVQGISNPQKPKATEAGGKDGSFGEMFANAIKEVDSMQKQADDQVAGLTLKKDGYTTHGAMLALEKADTAFQLMNNIRSKIIRAYEDVLRTQV